MTAVPGRPPRTDVDASKPPWWMRDGDPTLTTTPGVMQLDWADAEDPTEPEADLAWVGDYRSSGRREPELPPAPWWTRAWRRLAQVVGA